MPRATHRLALVLLGFLLASASASAQTVETPAPFDSAGKVVTINPPLVARFGLSAPGWPVQRDFVEARLYRSSAGGRVLVVERRDGTMERYTMSDEQVGQLRYAIDLAMARSGALVTEARADVVSEPARGAFVRNQMLLTWALYGPLLASLTNDEKVGTAAYFGATGASYFITSAIGRGTTVTRAQNHLSTDGALRGAAIAAGLTYTLGGEDVRDNTYAGLALAGAVTGAISGFQLGRGRTDSEAEAMSTVSNILGATALGIGGATGAFENDADDGGRGVVGAIVGAGIAGYAFGPSYPRRARYAVTRGDVQMLSVGAVLGAAAAVAPFVDNGTEPEVAFSVATSGLLGGVLFADRLMARRFDYSNSDATQVGLGLAAGALLGGAVVALAEPNESSVGVGIVTAGAILGTYAGHALANPPRAGDRRLNVRELPGTRVGGLRLRVDPGALALGAARVPGRHGVLNLTF